MLLNVIFIYIDNKYRIEIEDNTVCCIILIITGITAILTILAYLKYGDRKHD